MTIQYYDQEINSLGEDDRKRQKCPLCKKQTIWIRSNAKMTKHLEKIHGIEVKRY